MWLVFRSGARSGESVELTDAGVVVGRVEECDVELDDARVSRRHARFSVKPGDPKVALVEDLGSGNGTFVNGDEIKKPIELAGGEPVQIGMSVITVEHVDPNAVGAASIGTVIGPTQTIIARKKVERSVRRVALLAGGAVLIAGGAAAFLLTRDDGKNAVSQTVDHVRASTVLVQSIAGDKVVESGSGWVLDAAGGLIVTNGHVINGGERFQVGNGQGLRAGQVVGVAPCEDLAVLKVADLPGLRVLALGAQGALRQGQTVVAVGYPANASQEAELTSTSGVISVTRSAYREPAIDVPNYVNVVQHDAAINPGASGGPLVDLEGRLVGVNSAGRTIAADGRIIQGQSYAIGVDRVKEIVGDLRAGRSRGWTGAGFEWPTREDLTDPGFERGVRTAAAVAGTAAADSPLGRPGTRILRIGDQPVGSTMLGYCDAVGKIASGDEVEVEAIPDGSSRPRKFSIRFE